MNNDALLNSIFSSLSINEIIEKMDETQKDIFLREIFECVKNDIEWSEIGINNNIGISYAGYDKDSNSIIVLKKEFITEHPDYGALEVPIGLGYRYNISIDKLQDKINSLMSSNQKKTR